MAVSKRLRYEVMKRDGHMCRYCGRTAPEVKLTIDHVVPTTLGGSDDPDNLVTACADCNSGKSSSNPDAPLVANVADDALRWAQAQQLAAQQLLADMARRRETCQRFKVEWDQWTTVGRPIDLPVGWQNSVDNFLAAGLPMEVLLDCVTKAMSSRRVKPADAFRYMCGIAWKRVREMNEAAKLLLAPSCTPKTDPAEPYREAMYYLYGDIDGFDDDSLRPIMAAAFDEAHEDDEDAHGNPVDYSHWSVELKAAVQGLKEHIDSDYCYKNWLRHAMGVFPDEIRERYLDEAQEAHIKAGDSESDSDSLRRYAVLRIMREVFQQRPVAKDVWY